MSDNVAEGSTAAPRRQRLRWEWGAALVIMDVMIQLAIWWGMPPDATMQVIYSLMTHAGTFLLLGLWWIFFSGISWRNRGLGVLTFAACLGLFIACVRVRDFTGEVFPILEWRWTESREARAAKFFNEQKVAQVAVPEAGLQIAPDDWPAYRGPARDGVLPEQPLRTDWDTRPPKPLWQHPVGLGWSSFSVVDGLAFTQEQRGNQETVVCYDVRTGKQVWVHADPIRFTADPMGGAGPRATPTLFDGRLYATGATGRLNCLDPRTGKVLWTHDVLTEHEIDNAEYGQAASPLVYGDVVVVTPGGNKGWSVVAYDRVSGKLKWHTGDGPASYASPQLSDVDGVQTLLVYDREGLSGLETQSGKQLWRFAWVKTPPHRGAQPIVNQGNQILLSQGYGIGSVEIKVTHPNGKWMIEELYETKQLKLKFNPGILDGKYVYGLDEGILTCFDLEAGKRRWKAGRYGFGQVVRCGDLLLIQDEDGGVVLVELTPERFNEITRFKALDGKTWNQPTLWHDLLLVRNAEEAACYDLR